MAISVYTLQINYKSGIQQQMRVVDFTINPGSSITYELYNALDFTYGSPVYLGFENIESVWHLNTEEFEE